MTKSVTKTASKSPFCRNTESIGCKHSVPSQQAKELREFVGRAIPNGDGSIHTHKAVQADFDLNATSA